MIGVYRLKNIILNDKETKFFCRHFIVWATGQFPLRDYLVPHMKNVMFQLLFNEMDFLLPLRYGMKWQNDAGMIVNSLFHCYFQLLRFV